MGIKIEIDGNAVGEVLRKTTMLVQLTCRRWSGVKQDKGATQDVKRANQANGDIGMFRKNLLAGADAELKKIQQLQAAAYVKHKQLTLPWMVEGQRLLPATRLGFYLNEMDVFKRELKPLVDDFLNKYDQLVEQAKVNLGGLFDRNEYPPASMIHRQFDLDTTLNPVPASADWRSLSAFDDNAFKVLGAHTENKIVEAMKGGVIELRSRAKAWAERAERSLAPHPDDPSKAAVQFHATILTELERVDEDLRTLNVTDDRSCNELRMVTSEAVNVAMADIKSLRDSPSMREDLRMQAQRMLKILEDYEEGEAS